MENEIKVGEWIRTDNGIIGKYVKYRGIEDAIETNNKWIGFDIEKDIVKHSLNLIDLIQCGDYVNGYKVVETYKDKQLNGWQVGKSKEDETWLGVVVSSKMIKEPLQEYFDNEMIKTIVTKEMMESISYKVTKM